MIEVRNVLVDKTHSDPSMQLNTVSNTPSEIINDRLIKPRLEAVSLDRITLDVNDGMIYLLDAWKKMGFDTLVWKTFTEDTQLDQIIRLITQDLSEPYNFYTYRYFVYQWPWLCHLAYDADELVGVVLGKLSTRANGLRGYIAMLAVSSTYRRMGVGNSLVQRIVGTMLDARVVEIVLETEQNNIPALNLYRNLGFIRDKKLSKYYQGERDAYRLKYRVQ